MSDLTPERLTRLYDECVLAADVMAKRGTFETGQGVLRDAAATLAAQAAEIERLTRERDEALFLLRGEETVHASDNKYLLARATAAEAEREALRGLLDETTPFVAVAAAHIARSQGRPERHLLAPHYDLMQKLGLRVDDFTRAALGEQEPPNAQ